MVTTATPRMQALVFGILAFILALGAWALTIQDAPSYGPQTATVEQAAAQCTVTVRTDNEHVSCGN
jgi:hypothetical protein